MSTMQALPTEHPEMKAWGEYQASEEYKNSFDHAANQDYRDGSMWAAFDAGWRAAMETPANTVEAPKIQHILSRDQRDALVAANVLIASTQNGSEGIYRARLQKIMNVISDILYAE
jgi:hypothetical protein